MVLVGILGTELGFTYISTFETSYVPKIVNGFITAISIMVAMIVYSLNHIQQVNGKDSKKFAHN
jgi:hypothetical protein